MTYSMNLNKKKIHMVLAKHYPFASLNPYQGLMFRGLASHWINAIGIAGGLRELATEVRKGHADVLHLHWVHGAATFGNLPGALLRFGIFHSALLMARLKQKRIVWTVHNLVHHEHHRNWLDYLNSRLVALQAHAILVHGDSVIPVVASQLGVDKKKIHTIYHGNYKGIVQFQPPRKAKVGVRFLFFGLIRPYKGVENLLGAFQQLFGPHQLHIAGNVKFDNLKQTIEKHAADDPERITKELSFVSDERLQELLGWCDVVVLPYRDIFTSGSLLMAMTAGRPVVAPRAGLIPEYVDESMAFLYDPKDSNGLELALANAAGSDQLEEMAHYAAKRADDFDWDKICGKLAAIYAGDDQGVKSS